MKINGMNILHTAPIVGDIIIVATFELIAYMDWITREVGIEEFHISGFGVGIILLIVTSVKYTSILE